MAAASDPGPKNGRLTLAVAASLLLMVVLGIINVKLIFDPTIAKKAFEPVLQAKNDTKSEPHTVVNPVNKRVRVPPHLTFYNKLKTQDEIVEEANPWAEPAQKPAHTPTAPEGPPTPPVEPKAKAAHKPVALNHAKTPTPTECVLPNNAGKSKKYTVQVAAFSQPSIAQEWARKWKDKGYQVSLKPVARPKTGVIYQLYLGQFASEKEADALVKNLKAKEGVNAFRMVLRD